LDPADWLESFVATQIFTDKKDKNDSSTGWWAESLEEFTAGSELYKLKRQKLTPENVELAVQSVSNSLAYLQEQNAITLFDILPESENGVLLLNLRVLPASQPRMVDFGFHFRVE
jgi:phage gp46-like protein